MGGLPATWNNWVVENLLRGVPAETLLNTLLEKGFAYEPCRKVLAGNLSGDYKCHWDGAFYQSLANKLLATSADKIELIEDKKCQLYLWPEFLSASDCERLMELTDKKVRPSTLTTNEPDKYFRTSSSADVEHSDDPLISDINQLISEVTGIEQSWGEPLQVQRYLPTQEFKAHTDFFTPGTNEYQKYAGNLGQRTWTVMVYLNGDCEGGETEFVNLKQAFKPTQGTAVIWNNLHPDGSPNQDTLHHAHKVKNGKKYVITKWFRDRPYRR